MGSGNVLGRAKDRCLMQNLQRVARHQHVERRELPYTPGASICGPSVFETLKSQEAQPCLRSHA